MVATVFRLLLTVRQMWGDERRFCFDKFYGHLQMTDILRNNLKLNLFVQILSLDLSKPHILEAYIKNNIRNNLRFGITF